MSDNKIKILWIEDEPDSQNPPRDLGEYDEYFKVVCKAPSGHNDSIKSIDDYGKKVEGYHNGTFPDLFPVEIVSADYCLSKYNPSRGTVGQKNHENDDPDTDGPPEDQPTNDSAHKNSYQPFEHDGCIINVQYVTEFGGHPCGSVVTTYQNPKERHKTAKHLETYLKRAWGVDVSSNEGKERTWKNILETGVNALRKRIETLYLNSTISVAISDLMAIYECETEEFRFQSKYSERILPLKGIFIDTNDWREAAKKWVRDELLNKKLEQALSNHKASSFDDFHNVVIKGNALAEQIWDAFTNVPAWHRRCELSFLSDEKKNHHDTFDNKKQLRLAELANLFGGLTIQSHPMGDKYTLGNAVCKWPIIEMDDKNEEQMINQWAAIVILVRLMKLMVGIGNEKVKIDTTISTLDWAMATMPRPKSAIVPWAREFSKIDIEGTLKIKERLGFSIAQFLREGLLKHQQFELFFWTIAQQENLTERHWNFNSQFAKFRPKGLPCVCA